MFSLFRSRKSAYAPSRDPRPAGADADAKAGADADDKLRVRVSPEQLRVLASRSLVIRELASINEWDRRPSPDGGYLIDFAIFKDRLPAEIDTIKVLADIADYYSPAHAPAATALAGTDEPAPEPTSFDELARRRRAYAKLTDFLMMDRVSAFKRAMYSPSMRTFEMSLGSGGALHRRVMDERILRERMMRDGLYDSDPYHGTLVLNKRLARSLADYQMDRPSPSCLIGGQGADVGSMHACQACNAVKANAASSKSRCSAMAAFADLDLRARFDWLLGPTFKWLSDGMGIGETGGAMGPDACGFVVAGGLLTSIAYGANRWDADSFPAQNRHDVDLFFCAGSKVDASAVVTGAVRALRVRLEAQGFKMLYGACNDRAMTLHVVRANDLTRRRGSGSESGYDSDVSYPMDSDTDSLDSEDGIDVLVKIQIIKRVFETPSHVLHGFDLEPCKVLFDGRTLRCTSTFMNAYENRWMLLDQDKLSLSWKYRYVKYCHLYGLNVLVPGVSAESVDWLDTKSSSPIVQLYSCIRCREECVVESDYDTRNVSINRGYGWVRLNNYSRAYFAQMETVHMTRQSVCRGSFTGAFNPISLNVYDGLLDDI